MRISGKTQLCALIGDPVEHSLSPYIHNAAFKHLKLDFVYLAFKVSKENVKEALQGARALGTRGLNVTMPLKTAVIQHLDKLDPNTKKIGAVNTILNNDGTLTGYNTDGLGALEALRANGQNPEGKNILILGAGGAARAVAFALCEKASGMTILNRTQEKAEILSEELSKNFGKKIKHGGFNEETLKREVKKADILVNATSAGMAPQENETPVNMKLLHPNLTVFDLVYNPPETRLLREAKAIGAKTVDGICMLVYQGTLSFKIWTGRKAPVDVMIKACQKGLRTLRGE
ncbi:MAG: shikimate dehydrogenase [Candidatus Bathycorpusculaceae bacterium]